MEFYFEVAGSHTAAGNQVGVLRLWLQEVNIGVEAGDSKLHMRVGVGRLALWVEVHRTGSVPRRHGS